jgi:catechol 2,3-dioxygenase-like lactoylglutathione lyase family enzyme
MSPAITSAWKIIPQFKSRNIKASADFYTKELGFTLGGIDSDDIGEAQFCSVFVGDKAAANIYLHLFDGNGSFPKSSAMIALGTVQLDEFYHQVEGNNLVIITQAPEDKPWGYRQFTLLDPDGNELTFFKFLEGGNPGSE